MALREFQDTQGYTGGPCLKTNAEKFLNVKKERSEEEDSGAAGETTPEVTSRLLKGF